MGPVGVSRRTFVCALLLVPPLVLATPRRVRADEARARRLFSRRSERVILAVADVLVPAWNGHPAASGSADFLPHFEELLRATPGRANAFAQHWRDFTREVFARVPSAGSAEPDLVALDGVLRGWYDEYRSQPAPSDAARFFELLRVDVMRTCYSSPAGWAAVGYRGPVQRVHPRRPEPAPAHAGHAV